MPQPSIAASMDVLVIGGGGTLGRLVCGELQSRGHSPIPVGRRTGDLTDPAVLAAPRASVIINCAGASVAMALGRGWRGYRAVDVPIGRAAVTAARETGARLVYVGVHHAPEQRTTAYIDAHEQVASAMAALPDACVVRATGFYSAYLSLLPMARRGLLVDIGDGSARTNPICDRDLAEIVADVALGGDGPREIAAGGPDVMSRRQIFEAVAELAERRVRIGAMPTWLARATAALTRVVHPRIGQFMQFAVALAKHDVIAPALGTTRFADYVRSPDVVGRRTAA
jgi:uncharacterized protein YbjT (DUF2867 family)